MPFQQILYLQINDMVKVKNKKELKWCLEKHAKNEITIKYAANKLKITPRRFKQLYTQYKKPTTPLQQ